MKEVWKHITASTEKLANNLDAMTVSILEGRCPQVAGDLEVIEHDRSKIFPLVKESTTRQALWQRLREIHSVVPSLHTFLEDTKYLEPCAKILKQLLPKNSIRSVCQEFSRMHDGRCTLQEQQSEREVKLVRQPNAKVAYRQAYLQLWLYAMRHFPEMIGHTPRKDLLRTKPNVPQIEYIWWNGITNLAKECGFEDIVETYPTTADADHRMAEEFLASARPLQKFRISMDKANSCVQQLVDIIRSIDDGEGTEIHAPAPNVSSDSQECGSDVSSRCGIPHEQSFQQDCKWLFLKNMSMDPSLGSSVQSKYLTSFGVKKDMFQRFFRYELPDDDLAGHGMTPQDDEENHRPDNSALGNSEGNPRPNGVTEDIEDITMSQPPDQNNLPPTQTAPSPDQNAPPPDQTAPSSDQNIPPPDQTAPSSDLNAPPPDQTTKRRRSLEDSGGNVIDTSDTAAVPASYSLAISTDFLKESNVGLARAREIHNSTSVSPNLIIIKAKSTELYDVFSVPRARKDKILQCLSDENAKLFLTRDPSKRLRMSSMVDIVQKTEQPVLLVSSYDEKHIREVFEEVMEYEIT